MRHDWLTHSELAWQIYASTLQFRQNFRTRSASRESLSPTWQARKAVLFSIRMWMMPTPDCVHGAKRNAKLSVGGEAYTPK